MTSTAPAKRTQWKLESQTESFIARPAIRRFDAAPFPSYHVFHPKRALIPTEQMHVVTHVGEGVLQTEVFKAALEDSIRKLTAEMEAVKEKERVDSELKIAQDLEAAQEIEQASALLSTMAI